VVEIEVVVEEDVVPTGVVEVVETIAVVVAGAVGLPPLDESPQFDSRSTE
jgi:hypothetical protein